jgi:hypothetical protein
MAVTFLATYTHLKLTLEAQPLVPRTICGNCWRPIARTGPRRDMLGEWSHFTGDLFGGGDACGQDFSKVTGRTVKLAEPAPLRGAA